MKTILVLVKLSTSTKISTSFFKYHETCDMLIHSEKNKQTLISLPFINFLVSELWIHITLLFIKGHMKFYTKLNALYWP